MDKLILISCVLFAIADLFALTSVLNPKWVVSREKTGSITLGLVTQCLTIFGRDTVCQSPRLPPEWAVALFLIVCGVLSLTSTCILLVLSDKKTWALLYARWVAFFGMLFLCLASIVFPFGFYIDEIGGAAYKLPSNLTVGSSYVVFSLSIVLTVISELFAERVCHPIM